MQTAENKTTNTASASNKNAPSNTPFFQAKLTINEPGDIYEQEADAMADKVMRMPSSSLSSGEGWGEVFFKPNPLSVLHIQRKCTNCEEEEKKLQRKEITNGVPVANASTENYIGSLNGKGRSLASEERKFFEPRMGYDFSNVQLHTNVEANQSAKNINALAYTHGNNIVFGSGQYQTNTNDGKKLMAHELTHVVQQGELNSISNIQRATHDPQKPAPSGAPTFGNMPRDRPVSGFRLKLQQISGKWYEIRLGKEANKRRAAGWYDFVIQDGEIWAEKSDLYGHTEAARGERVTYAGQVKFTSHSGQITEWNNGSGHYRPSKVFAKNAEDAGFPLEKFKEHPDPFEQVQLPFFQPGTEPPAAGPESARGTTKGPDPDPLEAPVPTKVREEIGAPVKPVIEATPGYNPEAGAGIGGGIQMIQAKQFGSLQGAEITKYGQRLAELQPKIDAFLGNGYSVELILIVEQPNSIDLLCTAGAFCDQSQLIYFHKLCINRVESVRPVKPSPPRAPTPYPTISAGRESYKPTTSQGGCIDDEQVIPYLRARDSAHHCEYEKHTYYPPQPKPLVQPTPPSTPFHKVAIGKFVDGVVKFQNVAFNAESGFDDEDEEVFLTPHKDAKFLILKIPSKLKIWDGYDKEIDVPSDAVKPHNNDIVPVVNLDPEFPFSNVCAVFVFPILDDLESINVFRLGKPTQNQYLDARFKYYPNFSFGRWIRPENIEVIK